MNCSTPGLPVPHHLPKFSKVHVHCISDAIQPSHPLTPSSLSALDQKCSLIPMKYSCVWLLMSSEAWRFLISLLIISWFYQILIKGNQWTSWKPVTQKFQLLWERERKRLREKSMSVHTRTLGSNFCLILFSSFIVQIYISDLLIKAFSSPVNSVWIFCKAENTSISVLIWILYTTFT